MKRALLGGFVLLSAVAAACSGGGSSTGGATVNGRVQTELGIGIADASVEVGDSGTTSDGDGAFELGAKAGTRTLDVQAAGFRRVTADVRIASGDNRIEVTLVPCTPFEDAGCPTPTPTATPSPTPNVFATFSGTNADISGPSPFDPWTGSAELAGAAQTWSLGDAAESALTGGSDLAYSECWANPGETFEYNGVGTPDHCVFWFDGEGEGTTFPDAIFYVRIPGSVFVEDVPNTITFADGMTAGYYEGDFTGNQLHIPDYTLLHSAVEGTLVLEANGTLDGQAVRITGQATFRIPTLP